MMKDKYATFDSKSKEAFNIAQLGSLLARKQEYLSQIRYDTNGADVLAYNVATNETRAIQVKGRIHVHRRYLNRNLWIAFPNWLDNNHQAWYLIPHDILVELWGLEKIQNLDEGTFSLKIPKKLIESLGKYVLGSIVF